LLLAACVGGHRGDPGDPQRVTIPRGAGVAAVAETLAARALVPSADAFRFYARVSGRDRRIQAGTYEIPRGLGVREVLRILTTGRPAEERLVLAEGLMLVEVAAAVERQLGIPAESVLIAARDSGLRARIGTPGVTLEGYLYPSTYHVAAGATARRVVRRMVEEFESRWKPEWDRRLDTLDLSRHDVVTLASIIEGEVRYGPDRRFVSSVYHNRLRRGMRLQADPTVIYALGTRRRLYEKDYLTPSPYNTYLVDGLPPGPIAQPSAESLEAALYPAPTDFLYFVARSDGKHVFSRTLGEHTAAVRRVRQR
jgi:UPF0755 protein